MKKNTYCRSLPTWSENELYSPPYGLIKKSLTDPFKG